MDSWNAAQNWAVFIPIAAGLTAYYYWPRENKQSQTAKARSQPTPAANPAPKPAKASATKSPKKTAAAKAKPSPTPTDVAKQGEPKRHMGRNEPEEESEEEDAKEFARRMTQAMQGVDVKKPDAKATRVKTIKQSNAALSGTNGSFSASGSRDVAVEDSHDGATRDAGSVADMLEPAAAGPSTLRILASDKPVKAKPQKSAKEVKQSKKARQNERKKEEQRLQRDEDEKQRKVLEEKQRRTAREARGEPAKNGLAAARAPVDSAWNGQPAGSVPQASQSHAPLLDTFDEESASSSNAGASTAATSTADGDDVARAVKESLNDGAWTTAGNKKNKKKPKVAATEGEATPTPVKEPAPPVVKKVQPNGKPLGFQALTDEYEQRTDVDANDASNWDA